MNIEKHILKKFKLIFKIDKADLFFFLINKKLQLSKK